MTHAEWWSGKLSSLEAQLADAVAEAEALDRARPAGRRPYSEVDPAVELAEEEAHYQADTAWEHVGDLRERIERHRAMEDGTRTEWVDRPGGAKPYVVPAAYDGDPVLWAAR